MPAIRSLISSGETRLLMNLDDLRSWNNELARNFMNRPAEYLPAFEEALREVITNIDPSFAKEGATSEFKIGVTGSFGAWRHGRGGARSCAGAVASCGFFSKGGGTRRPLSMPAAP